MAGTIPGGAFLHSFVQHINKSGVDLPQTTQMRETQIRRYVLYSDPSAYLRFKSAESAGNLRQTTLRFLLPFYPDHRILLQVT